VIAQNAGPKILKQVTDNISELMVV